MEAFGLGAFMISACVFAVLIFHPASPLGEPVSSPLSRRFLMGIAMGLTAVVLVYSPWGQQSGAHFNPALTLTFCRLGKIAGWDAILYAVAQTLGGLAGVLIAAALLGPAVTDPSVNYVVTEPGPGGATVAFVGEVGISFGLMIVVLTVSNTARLASFTGIFAGALVAAYITLEAPLSGMSMNPARTFASAVPAGVWTAFWIYVVAPLLGMVLAAEVHVRLRRREVICAKLHHAGTRRCIFRCGYAGQPRTGSSSG